MAKPLFSIIMTTRNRPELFERALQSVLVQKNVELEVIVVNDGSSEEYLPAYKELENKYADQVTYLHLISSMNGHGQSYAINQGVLNASGAYIAFLDDDDFWTDEEHLFRAKKAFEADGEDLAIYCALQEAWLHEEKLTKPIWLEKNLPALLKTKSETEGVYVAARGDVVRGGAFSQVNVFILRRDLFLKAGGFDENIRYECDREFFLRAVDLEECILFANIYVSKHFVPDPTKNTNMSTAVKELTKLQYQLTVYTKLVLAAESKEVRKEAIAGQGYILKHISELLVSQNEHRKAARYAAMALGAQFSAKWALYTGYLAIRALFCKP